MPAATVETRDPAGTASSGRRKDSDIDADGDESDHGDNDILQGDDDDNDGDAEAGESVPGTRKSDETSALDPLDALARRGLVTVVSVHDAAAYVPHVLKAPFSLPVPFADRLGLFLADGAVMPTGAYPLPDDGNVSIYPYTSLVGAGGLSFSIHARDNHYGRARYSFVEMQAGTELWYARVWMLFSCIFRGVWYKLALGTMMKAISRERYNTSRKTFTWNSSHLDCFEVGHVRRTVIMVPSFIRQRAIDPEVFHLLE